MCGSVCVYRVVFILLVLFSLLGLHFLQFNFHGICDQSSEDAAGLSSLNERMLQEDKHTMYKHTVEPTSSVYPKSFALSVVQCTATRLWINLTLKSPREKKKIITETIQVIYRNKHVFRRTGARMLLLQQKKKTVWGSKLAITFFNRQDWVICFIFLFFWGPWKRGIYNVFNQSLKQCNRELQFYSEMASDNVLSHLKY